MTPELGIDGRRRLRGEVSDDRLDDVVLDRGQGGAPGTGPGVAARKVEFLDKDGFTAYQRGDYWFFQKFLAVSEMLALVLRRRREGRRRR